MAAPRWGLKDNQQTKYLILTKSIRCDGAAEFEHYDVFQVWCRQHQVLGLWSLWTLDMLIRDNVIIL